MIMNILPIHTKVDHKATLKEVSALMESDPEPGTSDGDRLDILVPLVQAYEARHTPMETPGSVNAVKPKA